VALKTQVDDYPKSDRNMLLINTMW
jgi:hypothetical protein